MPHHKPMVASNHAVPTRVDAGGFIVRPFLSTDNALDFDAWSTSIDDLKGIFGPASDWPNTNISLDDNAIEAAYHEREFRTASSFAYSVFDPEEAQCLGCIYLVPARKRDFEVECFFWVRASTASTPLASEIERFTRKWIEDAWPFKDVAFPGRDHSWNEYLQLPDANHW